MPGRTLRDAIAVALEVVPSVELAAGDEKSRRALREYLLGWIKDYALARGVVFEDDDLEHELRDVIAELRSGSEPLAEIVLVAHEPLDALDVKCPVCTAKPGEKCGTLVSCKYREPHTQRVTLAQKGAP